MYIQIDGHKVGEDKPVFIIAELSANHLQDYKLAVKSIQAIKKTGADAVKLQTFTPDTITLNCNNRYFRIRKGTLWSGKTLYQLYQKAYTPWDWQPKLKEIAENLGLVCFSTPFDKSAVDFLEKIKVGAYKIASFEITDLPLIEYAASKGKPMIISTGIAVTEEIREAVQACRKKGNNNIALLKCTSAYPTPLLEVNLMVIPYLKRKFKTVVGLSDHTLEISVPIAAVALGASIIEKHFILNRKLGGPDSAFSLEPEEFMTMVKSIRGVEKALGSSTLKLSKTAESSRTFSRSLFVVNNISRGEVFTERNVKSIRPGYGLPPKYLKNVLGRISKQNIKRGTPLSSKYFQR